MSQSNASRDTGLVSRDQVTLMASHDRHLLNLARKYRILPYKFRSIIMKSVHTEYNASNYADNLEMK